MSRVIHFFPNVHMMLSHTGLTAIAEKANLDPAGMKRGEFMLFLNRPCNAFKMLAPEGFLAYYRHPMNHRIDPGVFKYLPEFFGSDGKLNFESAMRKRLLSQVNRD